MNPTFQNLDDLYQNTFPHTPIVNLYQHTSPISNKCRLSTFISPKKSPQKLMPSHEFDIKKLKQTDVEEVMLSTSNNLMNSVSLAEKVGELIRRMGVLYSHQNEQLGTCTLIAHDLVMTARHVVENRKIPKLSVTFNYASFSSELSYVVEDDPKMDFAIIKLKTSLNELEPVELNRDALIGETVLLHQPANDGLKASVDIFDEEAFNDTYYTRSFHDSDFGSSGGAYFDPLGRLTAMHIGLNLKPITDNFSKHAIKLQDIIAQNPNSILVNPEIIQIKKTHLETYSGSSSVILEGAISQNLLTRKLAKEDDRKIKYTNANIVSFSKKNLNYLESEYHEVFNNVKKKCLYKTGLHRETKQYSIFGHIESDHIIPHNVWARTTLRSMKRLVKGKGARPGENEMPAITIPHDIHRNLRTTGSSLEAKKFHAKLIKLCDNNKVHLAFEKCLKEYLKHNIDLSKKKVKKAIKKCLDLHIEIGVIQENKRKRVLDILP